MMQDADHHDSSSTVVGLSVNCSGGEIFEILTGRWGMLILARLDVAPARFHALRDTLGVSEKVLSQTLRSLARNGLINRSVEATNPPQVTYSLTPVGCEAARLLADLTGWIHARADYVASARRLADRGPTLREAGTKGSGS